MDEHAGDECLHFRAGPRPSVPAREFTLRRSPVPLPVTGVGGGVPRYSVGILGSRAASLVFDCSIVGRAGSDRVCRGRERLRQTDGQRHGRLALLSCHSRASTTAPPLVLQVAARTSAQHGVEPHVHQNGCPVPFAVHANALEECFYFVIIPCTSSARNRSSLLCAYHFHLSLSLSLSHVTSTHTHTKTRTLFFLLLSQPPIFSSLLNFSHTHSHSCTRSLFLVCIYIYLSLSLRSLYVYVYMRVSLSLCVCVCVASQLCRRVRLSLSSAPLRDSLARKYQLRLQLGLRWTTTRAGRSFLHAGGLKYGNEGRWPGRRSRASASGREYLTLGTTLV